jgi:hypothetical protein
MTKRRARVLYFSSLLAVLAVVQLNAQVEQLRGGFRPFSHPPGRVAYSWDMFAIRLDRCVVGWDPPLAIDGQRVARWHDRVPPLEFDTVFNDADWYLAAAGRGCQYRTQAATVAYLQCFRSNGTADEHRYNCP